MSTAILTCDQVRAAERMAVEHGISQWALMQKAWQACADVLHAEFPDTRVIVLAGPGRRFFSIGLPMLLRGRPEMNALVALGSGAAYLYSAVVTLAPVKTA